ncbi:MAG TPA: T9SS type A sorting domain-containing protein [Chitinophagales bacterium]|jgi:hypothetical protein|nr:T9SS type A sorting domain-containing protein [Chitinophagales bacterium]MBP6153507.1 T9SS type A sorting domain-containing protein [Chitinophagales bacterium]HQV78627.1 T9SS type A sorting domain-containing protein [Chitinophagales bacterium]HQW78987.1 T9SS type A sorting domain-containing protein [Chitinophagales bacterium]HRB19769.1 T9SS type A sorting domain-containing protein [Chitinophagales bacterium]
MKHLLNKTMLLSIVFIAYVGTTFAQSDLLAENVSMSASTFANFQNEDKITFSDLIQQKNKTQLTVNTSTPTTIQVKYFNISGNMAKQETASLNKGLNEVDVNLDNLANGVYMVQFYTTQGSVVRRIVKD